MNEPEFAACIGLDWGGQKHYWRMHVTATGMRDEGWLLHTPETIDVWATGLAQRFEGRMVAVCLEQSRGPVVYQFAKYPHLVLYPAHPTTVSRYRDAFFPSGAKADPGDAGLLLEILQHHRDHLRRIDPDIAETRLLALLVEHRRMLVDERTRNSNRLTAVLKMYYPQPLDWIGDIDSPLGCGLLEQWPTLEHVQSVGPDQLRAFFAKFNSRSAARIEQRIEAIARAIPAVCDAALVEAGSTAVLSLVTVLKNLNARITVFGREGCRGGGETSGSFFVCGTSGRRTRSAASFVRGVRDAA